MKKIVTLFSAVVTIGILCLYVFQPNGTNVSHFDFLEHALHRSRGGFQESHHDGTGGWLTRWFTTSSQLRFSSGTTRQSSPTPRCPVYCYIDTSIHHRSSDEFGIVEAWSASFWALGFNPIVLTERDAKQNSQYNAFRTRGLVAGSGSRDLNKWLAIAQHGGLFVDYRVHLFRIPRLILCRAYRCRL
jgi:hypothetical protein